MKVVAPPSSEDATPLSRRSLHEPPRRTRTFTQDAYQLQRSVASSRSGRGSVEEVVQEARRRLLQLLQRQKLPDALRKAEARSLLLRALHRTLQAINEFSLLINELSNERCTARCRPSAR